MLEQPSPKTVIYNLFKCFWVFFSSDQQVWYSIIIYCWMTNLINQMQKIYLTEWSTAVYAMHRHPNIRDTLTHHFNRNICSFMLISQQRGCSTMQHNKSRQIQIKSFSQFPLWTLENVVFVTLIVAWRCGQTSWFSYFRNWWSFEMFMQNRMLQKRWQ